jgi:hypothetical protein
LRYLYGTTGTVTPGVQNYAGNVPVVPVRDYITSNYGEQYVGYDPATDSVIIGGRRIPVGNLKQYGGYEENGRAYLPSKTIEDILYGRI